MHARPHFRLAGVPVRIEPVFWLIAILLGFQLADLGLQYLLAWVGIVFVSVLVHEMGHALILKVFGRPSSVVLHGFGGLTFWNGELTKARRIAVSLAGPLPPMLLLGLPAFWARETYGAELSFEWWLVLELTVFVNVFWSLANLLPIRPLDGGKVATELFGLEAALILSIGTAVAAGLWVWLDENYTNFGLFFALFLAYINFREYRQLKSGHREPSAFDVEHPDPGGARRGRSPRRPPASRSGSPVIDFPGRSAGPGQDDAAATDAPGGLGRTLDPEAVASRAWNALRRNDPAGAARLVGRVPPGQMDPYLPATIAVARGNGVEQLARAYLDRPGGAPNLVTAAVVAEAGQSTRLAERLVEAGPDGVGAAATLQTHLHYAKRYAEAARAGEVLYGAGANGRAQVAFEVACSWARAGAAERSLRWVERAVADGFNAPRVLDTEPDLATARDHPGWAEVRARLN